jgi:subtilisin family serine protease
MPKIVGVVSALALAIGLGSPAAATGFVSSSEVQNRLVGVSESCKSVALTYIPNGNCEVETYLVSFVSDRAQTSAEYYEDESLAATIDLIQTSAFALNGFELADLVRQPGIIQISPDQEVSLQGTQSGAPWHLDRLDQTQLPLDSTYNYVDAEQGQNVSVYVVDTGVNTSHIEFTGRITRGYSSIGAASDYNDCNGHGSHVAGLAAGTITGAAKLAEVVPVRVLDCSGNGSLLGVLMGLDWIAGNTLVGQPAVVNMSLGGDPNTYLDSAVANLSAQGLVFVVAAGNTGSDACNVSPARVPAAITIAASASDDSWAPYSNSGACVDFIAPGSDTRSAWIGANNAAALASGTSMAAGVVSGIVATQMSYGHQTPAALTSALAAGARSGLVTGVPAPTANLLVSNTVAFSAPGTSTGNTDLGEVAPPATDGTVSVGPVPAPTTPTNPAATSPLAIAKPTVQMVDGNALVTWTLPQDGGSPILSQIMQVFSGTTKINEITLQPGETSFTLTNLSPNVAYRVQIAAVNIIGTAPYSEFSETFGMDVQTQLNGPAGGEFSAWVKKINSTQVKMYAKFPQLNQKIQFMVQGTDGRYRERGWVRITEAQLNDLGDYTSLTNGVYFVRTVNLREGKNRLRILVDGQQLGATRTYSR